MRRRSWVNHELQSASAPPARNERIHFNATSTYRLAVAHIGEARCQLERINDLGPERRVPLDAEREDSTKDALAERALRHLVVRVRLEAGVRAPSARSLAGFEEGWGERTRRPGGLRASVRERGR